MKGNEIFCQFDQAINHSIGSTVERTNARLGHTGETIISFADPEGGEKIVYLCSIFLLGTDKQTTTKSMALMSYEIPMFDADEVALHKFPV